MTTDQTRRYEMFERVVEFGNARRDRFPESSRGGKAFAMVAAAAQALKAHAEARTASQAAKGKKALARAALFEQLDAISRTARVIAEETPDFDVGFQMPGKPGDQALLTAGRVFAGKAEAAQGQFIANGMPSTFAATLRERVEAFDRAFRHREARKVGRRAARAGIEAALASGLAASRTLDVIVGNQLHDDPAEMGAWEAARRVGFPKRAKRGDDPPPVALEPSPPEAAAPPAAAQPPPTSEAA